MSVILIYIEVCQQFGPDIISQSISVETNYVFKNLRMQDIDVSPVNSSSATDIKDGFSCESL